MTCIPDGFEYYKKAEKPYSEVQDLLKAFIDEGDPDAVVFLFEKAFDKVVDGTASYNSGNGTVEYEEDTLSEAWFGDSG